MNASQIAIIVPGALAVLLAILVPGAPLVAPLGVFFLLITYLIYRWSHIYVPMFMGKRVIRTKDAFSFSPAHDAVVRKEGEDYIATIYLALDVYETMTAKSENQIYDYAGYFERVLSSFNDPIKISTILYESDMSRYLDELHQLKGDVEMKIANAKSEREREVLEREKIMWEKRIESLYKYPKKPLSVYYVVSVSAKGYSVDSAVAAARNRASEVKAVFSSGLSLSVSELAGKKMDFCYSLEGMVSDW